MAFGRVPQSFIDDVLLRTDIVDLIDGRVKLKKAGKNYSACCPFHNEKTPSFTVSREKQFYYCFGCGASGNAVSFLMDYERLGFVDALKQLAGSAGLELPDTRDDSGTPRESQQPLYDTLEAAAKFYEEQLRRSPLKDKAVSYFKGRGLSGQIAKTYRLGYAPPGWDNLLKAQGAELGSRERLLATGLLVRNENRQSVYDAMRDRVIFPIRDFRGRVIAFGGRVLTDEKPKYLNSPESPVFHKGQELYGLFEARQATRKLERVVVVEGYMDVVALAQFGITYAVATLGTATSTTHVERLFRLVPEVIYCFDGDEAGRRAAWRALENTLPALQDGKLVSFLFLPTNEDPDSLVRKEGPELFEARLKSQSESLADFFFRHISEDLRLDTLEGRTRLATEAKPLLATIPDGLYREMLLDELARRTGLEKAMLKNTLLAPKPVAAEPAPSPRSTTSAPAPYYDPADNFVDFGDSGGHYQENPGWQPQGERPWRKRRDAAPAPAGDDPSQWEDAPEPKPGDWGGRRSGGRFSPVRRKPRTPLPAGAISLTDRAIRLLLQNPQESQLIEPTVVAPLLDDDGEVLLELLSLLHENPGMSIPALLGAWYGTSVGDRLGELAASEFLTPGEGVGQEFQDVIKRLELLALEREIEQIIRDLATNPDGNLLVRLQQLKNQHSQLLKIATSGPTG